MNFQFATANRILFGPGTVKKLSGIVESAAKKVLVITGRDQNRAKPAIRELEKVNIPYTVFPVQNEPTIENVQNGCEQARSSGAKIVIGIGGGSVIDAGKAIAALLTNPGNIFDYLEVIGKGKSTRFPSTPYIALPTTAGTGAEVTRNAVLTSPEHAVKISMRGPFLLPDTAIVDPELTVSMPPDVTASTGLDALTQLLEAFVSHKANPVTDGICREGLKRAATGLQRAFRNGKDRQAREDMAVASLFGGLALANAGLGAVHGFAGPVGAMFSIPHGTLCGRLLPFTMVVNVTALRLRAPQSQALKRYAEVAEILTGKRGAEAEEGVDWIQELCTELAVPSLKSFGLHPGNLAIAVEKSQSASSMKGNPIALTAEELTGILQRAL